MATSHTGTPDSVAAEDVGAAVPVSSAEEGFATWRRGVAGVLAKARRVDVSELPEHPETLLEVTTYDGVTVRPLYGPLDETAEAPLPGTFPFTRGTDAHRDVNVGWLVAGRFGRPAGADSDAATLNDQLLDALQNGTSALWLDTASVGAEGLARALDGVLLDLAPLTLDAGADVTAVADALFALLDERGAAADVRLGASPLTDRFADLPGASEQDAIDLAVRAVARTERVRAITLDGTVFHAAGSADAQEVGLTVAAGLEYLRALTAAGLSAGEALGQVEFRLAATDEQFETIAKFRAARRVWARVAEVLGAPEHGGAPQHAVTSAAMMTQRDPWVNMLRTTLAAFGAGVGGADAVTVLPFDAAIPGGAADVSQTFAARIARNTQLLLLEESHLGRVVDPAGGSWYVESLTDALADSAWSVLQAVEAAGGYRAALESGEIARRVEETRAARASDIAHRRTAVTGVNEFPNLQEPSPAASGNGTVAGRPATRYAAEFEALRDRSDAVLADKGSRPVVLLAPLGSVAEHNGRTTFAANLMASGGIEAVNPGAGADLAAVARETASPIAVLCGTDKRYAAEGPDAVAALRSAGVRTVLVAGGASAFADASPEQTPDGHLTLTIDAVAELSALLDALTGEARTEGHTA
ncbi:methylmalonyl-CoA mutase family protein [Rhodococcus sp. MEB041]|uniref:methylmalonyl-CoA mutase family protein n=1 Tax=Rhodococcus sp. MEB041 TaxID=3040323 RepID=UPI00254ECD33|nr:methylmalonyl-CoA mutase family protein [Rhodococcus sp. MEB041]